MQWKFVHEMSDYWNWNSWNIGQTLLVVIFLFLHNCIIYTLWIYSTYIPMLIILHSCLVLPFHTNSDHDKTVNLNKLPVSYFSFLFQCIPLAGWFCANGPCGISSSKFPSSFAILLKIKCFIRNNQMDLSYTHTEEKPAFVDFFDEY